MAPPEGQPTVWLHGLPQGNPPRALAFKLKAGLRLQATPVLVQSGAAAALLLPGNESDAARLRQAAAHGLAFVAGDETRPLPELGLGPSVRIALRGGSADGAQSMPEPAPDGPPREEHPVDARPWGAFVMHRTAESNLAPGPPAAPPPEPETWEKGHGLAVSETAKRVLRGGGTDPKGLTVARGGFDDHTEKGTYLCAGCHSPLYGSEAKWECGCGWPGFWTCRPDALYEKRDGARGEIRCTTCDVSRSYNTPLDRANKELTRRCS
jgi:peptide methionine sulfoxide reductase MsrB